MGERRPSAIGLARAKFVPDHWPVVEDGLLMAYVGPVMVVATEREISDAVFDRQMHELEVAFDCIAKHWDPRSGVPGGSLWEVVGTNADATRRKRIGALLDRRRTLLAETTAGFVLATASPLVRGILRAVFWLAPPPYPYAVTADARQGFAFLSTKLPGLDPIAAHADYERLRRHHRR
jgi:hypothetical protein